MGKFIVMVVFGLLSTLMFLPGMVAAYSEDITLEVSEDGATVKRVFHLAPDYYRELKFVGKPFPTNFEAYDYETGEKGDVDSYLISPTTKKFRVTQRGDGALVYVKYFSPINAGKIGDTYYAYFSWGGGGRVGTTYDLEIVMPGYFKPAFAYPSGYSVTHTKKSTIIKGLQGESAEDKWFTTWAFFDTKEYKLKKNLPEMSKDFYGVWELKDYNSEEDKLYNGTVERFIVEEGPDYFVYKTIKTINPIEERNVTKIWFDKGSERRTKVKKKLGGRYRILSRIPSGAFRFKATNLDIGDNWYNYKIVGEETVNTPAGSFDCYKMKVIGIKDDNTKTYRYFDKKTGVKVEEEKYRGIDLVYEEQLEKLQFKPPVPKITVLANSVDYNLASGFFGFLENNGIEVTRTIGSEFNRYKDSKFIVILGGPDAYNGVGDIVSGVITDREAENIREEGSGKMIVKTNVWRKGQVVMILAGSNREMTQEACEENKGSVTSKVK